MPTLCIYPSCEQFSVSLRPWGISLPYCDFGIAIRYAYCWKHVEEAREHYLSIPVAEQYRQENNLLNRLRYHMIHIDPKPPIPASVPLKPLESLSMHKLRRGAELAFDQIQQDEQQDYQTLTEQFYTGRNQADIKAKRRMLDHAEQETACPICCAEFGTRSHERVYLFPCHHNICTSCWNELARRALRARQSYVSCPYCRQPVYDII